jgi:hypothetical protein
LRNAAAFGTPSAKGLVQKKVPLDRCPSVGLTGSPKALGERSAQSLSYNRSELMSLKDAAKGIRPQQPSKPENKPVPAPPKPAQPTKSK